MYRKTRSFIAFYPQILLKTQYFYDGEGRRVKKIDPLSQVTIFVYGVEGSLTEEYNQEAQTQSGIQYVSQDHLGSTRLITDASGNSVKCYDYMPFSEQLWSGTSGRSALFGSPTVSDNQKIRFSGKERDSESGLDYFGARYFSGPQGRFTSTDPLLNSGRPDDPQSWNRYTYVNNNPLRFTDPRGLYKWASNCDESKDSGCKADRDRFRNALADLRKAAKELEEGSNGRKQLEKIIKRIGDEGKGSTRIAFGDAGTSDGLPNLGFTVGNKMTLNFAETTKFGNDWQLSSSERTALDAGLVGHEGAHLGRGGIMTEFFTMHGEHAAYYSESLTYQGLHNTDRPFGIWNESWLKVDLKVLEQNREKAIQNAIHPPKVQK